MINQFLGKIIAHWNAQTVFSKVFIMLSLLLVFMAYQPTLQFKYVTPDQWRVFRYSTAEKTPIYRMEACAKLIPSFYIMTGRPLVWPTECLEDAAVGRMSDFVYLRPIVLSIVLITLVYLGAVIASILDNLPLGMMTSSILLMTPGYALMYFQGMTGAMVLISLILATASFDTLRKLLNGKFNKNKFIIKGIKPFILFFLACLIYPIWAFIVVPLSFAECSFTNNISLHAKFKRILSFLSFYFIAAILYYIFVKISIFIFLKFVGNYPNLGGYNVAMQLNPFVIIGRSITAIKIFFWMIPFNFLTAHGFPLLILILFSIYIGYINYKNKQTNLYQSIALVPVAFLFCLVILLGSISPWLFSGFSSLPSFLLLPWYLFFFVVSAGLIFSVIKNFSDKNKKLFITLILIGFFIPVSAIQNKISFLQIFVSDYEIWNMRLGINKWLNKKDYINNKRFLLLVLSKRTKPAISDAWLDGVVHLKEDAILSTSQNPVSIPWMINAILRERPDLAKSIKMVYCGFNRTCINQYLLDSSKIVIGATYGDKPIKSIERPFVINLSTITSKPIYPKIVKLSRKMFPKVVASSQFKSYGPQGLLFSEEPGWNAAVPLKYPQSITINFHYIKVISQIGFLPQDGLPDRAPKEVRIKWSTDGKVWQAFFNADIGCSKNSVWHYINLQPHIKAKFIKILILKNCGDPNYLTIRGLSFK
jgi:hypothetical protein